jgi:hypothetical protein
MAILVSFFLPVSGQAQFPAGSLDGRKWNESPQKAWTNIDGGGDFTKLRFLPASVPVSVAPDSDSIGVNLRKKNPTGAMLRSLIFPGWGQFYNGKYLKAALAFAVETSLVATAVYWNQQAVKATEDERLFYQHNRNTANWWLAATILISMFDAYVDAHLSDFDESPDLSLVPVAPEARASPALLIRFKIGL